MEDSPTLKAIKKEIDDNDIVLFMKGTVDFPQCGFSSTVVQVLQRLRTKFKDINVLDDMEIREGIKEHRPHLLHHNSIEYRFLFLDQA